jgi:hypothetical protein
LTSHKIEHVIGGKVLFLVISVHERRRNEKNVWTDARLEAEMQGKWVKEGNRRPEKRSGMQEV